jgi:L-threonylcarbamoyladenylate synthase
MIGSLTVPFWSPEEVDRAIPLAIEHFAERRVIAYPTETVYGFGGAIDSESIASLVTLKRRPRGKPFLLLVDGTHMLGRLDLRLPAYAGEMVARHWPGPLTVVLTGGEGRVSPQLRGPEGGVAVRWTSHEPTRRLIRAHGDAITSTSANLPGVPPAESAAEVESQWRAAIMSGVLLVLDGGRLAPSRPSTVVDCTGRVPRVIRPGAIPASVLRESAPNLLGDI